MLNMHKKILVTALGLTSFAGASLAGLQAVDPGPYTAATGYFPLYYTDTNNLTLDLCLSKAVNAAGGQLCNLLPNPGVFDPLKPVVFPVNFPDEAFWFTADAQLVGQAGIDLLYVAHLEAAFAAGLPVPGDQVSFARIRIRADFDVTVPTPGVYRITHPYGSKEFSIAAPGRRVINDTVDIGIGAPGDFRGALGGQIGPFLVHANEQGGTALPFIEGLDPETLLPNGEFFVGDPNVVQFVTGSPFGTNFVRVQRIANLGGNPTGDIDVSTDQFFLSGRVWNGQRPTDVTVDRASYSRKLDPVTLAVTTRIDGFATSAPTSEVCYRESLDLVPPAPGNPCKITMEGDGGKFFGQDSNALAVPPYIVVTANDTGKTPTPVAQALADVIKVSKADYAKDTHKLVVEATSSDEAAPPRITALGLGVLSRIPGTIAGQRLQVDLGALGTASAKEPPAFVTLVSSGGGRHSEPVKIVAAAAAGNQNPVANDDSATTPEDTPVTIPVLGNDTDADGDTPTVTGVTNPSGGTATLNADGSIRFAPALNFHGTAGFDYAIADGKGGIDSAHVAVTVTPVNDPPTVTSTPVTGATLNQPYSYDVNATDPDGDTLSYSLVTAPAGMTINAGTGLITWTPTVSGNRTVSVQVTDNGTPNGGQPAPLSVTQTYTVTVGAGVDLDIASLSAPTSGRVGRALSAVTINVRNAGTINQTRTATLTGTGAGVTYSRTISVSDPVGGGTSRFTFPGSNVTPTATGTINWRVEIFDDNPDVDVASAVTSVPR